MELDVEREWRKNGCEKYVKKIATPTAGRGGWREREREREREKEDRKCSMSTNCLLGPPLATRLNGLSIE